MNDTNNIRKIIMVILVLVIVPTVFYVWQKQNTSQVKNKQVAPISNTNVTTQVTTTDQATVIKNSLLTTKAISGIVVSSDKSQITIKTRLVDISALDKFDFKASKALPMLDKNLTVSITNSTVIPANKFVVGGLVVIQTKEPVYANGTLTALSINVITPPK